MKKLMLIIMIGWCIAALACQPDEAPAPEHTLAAHAGADQQVWVQNPVRLDGSLSKASDGEAFEVAWRFLSRPEGSQAILQDTGSLSSIFTPDRPGLYIIELRISHASGHSTDQVTITASVPAEVVYLPFFEDSVVSYENNPAIDVDQDGEIDYVFTAEYFSFADQRVELQFYAVSAQANQLVLSEGQAPVYREDDLISEETRHPYTWDVQSGRLLTRVDRAGTISWEGTWKGQQKQYLPFRLRKDEQRGCYGWFCISADEENERMVLHGAAYALTPNSTLYAGKLAVPDF